MNKGNAKNLFLTGITGNLGAFAAYRFLNMGYRITALVRAKTKLTTDAHIKKMIKSLSTWMPVEEVQHFIDAGKLIAIKCEMTQTEEMKGIQLDDIFDETWHFASSLKYMPKDRDEIYAANIDGVKNVLDLHKRHSNRDSKFIYISTAYVGGRTVTHLKEEQLLLTEDLTFKNEYEKSKLMAENIVLDYGRDEQVFSVVFRPSIVMGDTKTKRLINYTGFYLALDSLVNLNSYIKNATGEVEVLRFESDNDIGLNLIPIDHVIDNMVFINERVQEPHQVFNITNKTNIGIKELQNIVAFSHLRINVVPNEAFERTPRTRSEKLMSYGFNYILPYANNKVKFSTERTARILGATYDYPYYPNKIEEVVDDYVNRKQVAEIVG